MTDREIMQQALEALEQYTDVVTSVNDPNSWVTVADGGKPAREAITALRERLAQPQRTHWEGCEEVHPECRKPEQEPVLETVYETIIQWDEGGGKRSRRGLARRIVALYTATQPEQEPVDSAEKAGAYMDARLWEFIDMAAAWPQAKPDPRTWGHVMVYAPKPAWRDHVEQRLLRWRQSFVNKSGDQLALDDFMDKRSLDDLIDFVCDEYTAPQSAQQPLTDEEIRRIELAVQGYTRQPFDVTAFARAIEAAHGIKENT
jgi:hypothetical protein